MALDMVDLESPVCFAACPSVSKSAPVVYGVADRTIATVVYATVALCR